MPSFLQKGKQKHHDYFYWEFHENNGRQAVHWGKWKGIKPDVTINDNAPVELYDLEKDPIEQNNIAEKNPAIVKKIEALMREAHVKNRDWLLLKKERIEK